MPHFIYCGDYYHWEKEGENREQTLKEMILSKMRLYGIQSSILTLLHMRRENLITKEKAKKAAEGKLKNDRNWGGYEGSINDDLERFFIYLQNQKDVKEEEVFSFFTPKLTNEELKFVRDGNEEHLNTYVSYFDGLNPDVDVEEMDESDSDSKYVHVQCERITIPLILANKRTTANEDEMSDTAKKTF